MHPFTDTGLVVRTYDLGEADRIVTVLTHDHGLVRAVARAVRRTRSRMGASLEPFAVVDVQVAPGRGRSGLGTIRQATSRESLARPMVGDYPTYTAGCVVLETAERLAGEERAPAQHLHRLTVGALAALAEDRRERQLILDAFLLRAMSSAGWMPALAVCARCAQPGPHRAFHVAAGGAVCVHCRPAGAATPSLGVLDLMESLARGEWELVAQATDSQRRQATGLTAAHLQWHLERQLRTLPLIERQAPHRLIERPTTPEPPIAVSPAAGTA